MDKCSGVGCPLTINCKRYSKTVNKVGIYFHKPPFEIKNGLFSCKFYIGAPEKYLFHQLTELFNHERSPIKIGEIITAKLKGKKAKNKD